MSLKSKIKRAEKNILKELEKENLSFVYKKIEVPLIPTINKINNTGFAFDTKKAKKLSEKFHEESNKISQKIFGIVGKEFNIKSTQQLSKILFQELNLPTKGLKKTPGGVISTKESELKKLQGEHQIIDLILKYRELEKMITTYIDNLIPQVKDGRIYSELLQLGTTTGRMASKNPNIQNIPVGGEYGFKIRELFIAPKNKKLLSMDYSQIELRLASIISQDEKLLKFFQENRDIHSAVAMEIFSEETTESRKKAKVINFGILYGMGANALKINLSTKEHKLELKDAREYINQYFEKFQGLAKYIENIKQETAEKEFTETLYLRKRFFPEINSKQPFIRAMAERMAINAPIQGSSADIIKLAMIEIEEYLEKNNLTEKIKIIAQVHDELIFEMDENIEEKNILYIKKIMENILEQYPPLLKIKKIVPLKINYSIGTNWAELK